VGVSVLEGHEPVVGGFGVVVAVAGGVGGGKVPAEAVVGLSTGDPVPGDGRCLVVRGVAIGDGGCAGGCGVGAVAVGVTA
jgi:hypothetical protein